MSRVLLERVDLSIFVERLDKAVLAIKRGHHKAAAKQVSSVATDLSNLPDAETRQGIGYVAGMCQACARPIILGERYVSVAQVGPGAYPEPDLFHAKCEGAFREGWGA